MVTDDNYWMTMLPICLLSFFHTGKTLRDAFEMYGGFYYYFIIVTITTSVCTENRLEVKYYKHCIDGASWTLCIQITEAGKKEDQWLVSLPTKTNLRFVACKAVSSQGFSLRRSQKWSKEQMIRSEMFVCVYLTPLGRLMKVWRLLAMKNLHPFQSSKWLMVKYAVLTLVLVLIWRYKKSISLMFVLWQFSYWWLDILVISCCNYFLHSNKQSI